VFANGGYRVEPYFIDRIETTDGEVVYRANPTIVCRDCPEAEQKPEDKQDTTEVANNEQPVQPDVSPELQQQLENGQSIPGEVVEQPKRYAKRVVSPQVMYIMTSILQDVIKHGTGKRALELNRGDIAGKTGTTNDQRDAWFSGFNPDVVTTAWVGFDTPHPLGDNEFGSRAALPMWMDFMREALKGKPEHYHERPPGLVNVKIDPKTGYVVGAGHPDGVFEIFREDHVPPPASDSITASDASSGVGGTAAAPSDNVQDSIF
jgi:penicillin-binding protein 1A